MGKFFFQKLAVQGLWIGFGLIILLSSFKNNLVLSPALSAKVRGYFPEGWGFFTKEPREELMDVYFINNFGLQEADLANVSAGNLFGLSRESRMKGYELSMILSKIPRKFWKSGNRRNLMSHINDLPVKVKDVKNFKYFSHGRLLIKMHKPVPWIWANRGQEENTPFKVLRIDINE